MTDTVNWNAPLHAPTEPGKYVCRNGEVVDVEPPFGNWKHDDCQYYWSGAYDARRPHERDIIGKYVEPPPDELWTYKYPHGAYSDGLHEREAAERSARQSGTNMIKRYVIAEIINLSDDKSGAKQ